MDVLAHGAVGHVWGVGIVLGLRVSNFSFSATTLIDFSEIAVSPCHAETLPERSSFPIASLLVNAARKPYLVQPIMEGS